MPRTSERKAILAELESHMEDAIELAALEDDKESRRWWSTVEDLIEVYEILSIPRYISPLEQGPRHDESVLDRFSYAKDLVVITGYSSVAVTAFAIFCCLCCLRCVLLPLLPLLDFASFTGFRWFCCLCHAMNEKLMNP